MNSRPIARNISVVNCNDEKVAVDLRNHDIPAFDEIVFKSNAMARGPTDHKLTIGPDCGPPSHIFLCSLDSPIKHSKEESSLDHDNRSKFLSSKIQDILNIIEDDHHLDRSNSDNEDVTISEPNDDESYIGSSRAYHQRSFPIMENKIADTEIDDNTLPSEDDEIDNYNDTFLTDEMYLYNIEDYSLPLLSDESDDLNPSFLEQDEEKQPEDDNRALHIRRSFDSEDIRDEKQELSIAHNGCQSSPKPHFPLRAWKDATKMNSRCLDIWEY